MMDHLTLNLGVRWEYYPTLRRANRPYEVVEWDKVISGTGPMVLDLRGGSNVKVSKKLFGPRVGFAYRLSDKDVLRAGYGITVDPYPLSRPLRGSFPLTITASESSQTSYIPYGNLTANGIPFFEGPDTDLPTALIPGNVSIRTMPQDFFKRGYIQSWNIMYERKFPADFVISFGYVGTQTVRSLSSQNMNWSKPGTGNSGKLLNKPAFDNRTASTSYFEGMRSGNYHSLQIAINRRFVNGIFVKGAYTYSKAINMADDAGGGVSWNDPLVMARSRANAGYNTPHVFQWATLYQVPFGKGGEGAADVILRNWQLNGVFSVNSNRNANVSANSGNLNSSGNTQTADQVGEIVKLGHIGKEGTYYDTSAFAQPTRVPGVDCTDTDCYGTSGRNIIRGPTWVNLDLSLFRKFNFTEWLGMEFRAEAFNVTNTPKFANPNFSVTSSNFMKILSTTENALSRSIRFGIKFVW